MRVPVASLFSKCACLPRLSLVLYPYTPLAWKSIRHMLVSSFLTKIVSSQIVALRSCPTPLFVNYSLSFAILFQYLTSDHVYISLLQTYATH